MSLDELLRQARIENAMAQRAVIEYGEGITDWKYQTLCTKQKESAAVVRWLSDKIIHGL